jgi:hypothetical protein
VGTGFAEKDMRQQDMTTENEGLVGAREDTRAYDLALQSNRQRLAFGVRTRRITLAGDRLDWEIDDQPDAALLASIVEINLRTGGSWNHPVAQCRIRFKDGFILIVSDAATTGYPDEAKRSIYREFVHDLHRRLTALPDLQARFVTGVTKRQFHVIALGALFFLAIGVGVPIAVLFLAPGWELVLLLITGVAFVWPLLRMLHYNSPGTYDPRKLPTELAP